MTSPKQAGTASKGRSSRGRIPDTSAPPATTETTTPRPTDAKNLGEFFRQSLVVAVEFTVDAAFDLHRLAYIWHDDDTLDDAGKPTTLFVCKCQEAFDRSAYNRHIRDKYKEVI